MKIVLIWGIILILAAIGLSIHQQFPQYTTRICAWTPNDNDWQSPVVCNDYSGYLKTQANGCTAIPIVDHSDSEICGNYTLEHIRK